MSLRGEIVFAISPRLLLASLEKIRIVASYDPIYNLEHWENLNAAYLNLLDSSAAKGRIEAPTKCRSLQYSWDDDPTPVWLSYILAIQPIAFANLTALKIEHVLDLPKAQTILALAGAGLQTLVVHIARPSSYLTLDLSHNTGLQVLTLYYERDHASVVRTPMLQKGPSIVEASLKTANAPSLRDVSIVVASLECCGAQSLQQSPHLQRFDACFADLSERYPRLGHLEVSIHFEHYPSCEDNVTCSWSPLNNLSDHQTALKGHFPFLTTGKPPRLEVDLGWDLEF